MPDCKLIRFGAAEDLEEEDGPVLLLFGTGGGSISRECCDTCGLEGAGDGPRRELVPPSVVDRFRDGADLRLEFELVDFILMSASSLEMDECVGKSSSSSVSPPRTSRLKPMLVFGLEGGGKLIFSSAWFKSDKDEDGGCEGRENVKERT